MAESADGDVAGLADLQQVVDELRAAAAMPRPAPIAGGRSSTMGAFHGARAAAETAARTFDRLWTEVNRELD
jgi:hypothetical protein